MFCQFDLTSTGPGNNAKNLECPPVFKYLIFSKDGKWLKFLLRGDAEGRLAVWKVPDTPECAMMQLKRSEAGGNGEVTLHPLQYVISLNEVWASLDPAPPGVLNQVKHGLPILFFHVNSILLINQSIDHFSSRKSL